MPRAKANSGKPSTPATRKPSAGTSGAASPSRRPGGKPPSGQGTQRTPVRAGASNPTKVLKSRIVYRAPVFYVTSEQVREPSGVTARRDIVRHPGSVVIMAVDDSRGEPRVLLIRQFRYAAGQELWEFPAGRVDAGEELAAAARRELTEETGFTARNWKPAIFFWSSPGFLDETMTIFLARDLRRGKAQPEEDEVIRARFFPLSTAVKMALTGKIQDAKTLTGVLWLGNKLSGRKS